MFKIFDGKPDHPMFDAKEARRLLAELPKDDPFRELEEIASWLDTVKGAQGFRPEVRAEIIMLLDETGQSLYAELLQLYLGTPHLQDFKGKHLWQNLYNTMQTLSEAYFSMCARISAGRKKVFRPQGTHAGHLRQAIARRCRADEAAVDALCGY